MSMYCRIWKYNVSSNNAKFEEEYGRNGSWFKFFETSEDYLGSELMKHGTGKSYVVIDKWMSKADCQDFLDENKADYDQMSEKCKALYDDEEDMGEFDILQ